MNQKTTTDMDSTLIGKMVLGAIDLFANFSMTNETLVKFAKVNVELVVKTFVFVCMVHFAYWALKFLVVKAFQTGKTLFSLLYKTIFLLMATASAVLIWDYWIFLTTGANIEYQAYITSLMNKLVSSHITGGNINGFTTHINNFNFTVPSFSFFG
jgi:hypothetical protein